MMMPTNPAPCFIVSQTDFTFRLLKDFLDLVPTTAHRNQLPQSCRARVAQVVGRPLLWVEHPGNDQRLRRPGTAIFVLGLHADLDGSHLERSFGTVTYGNRFPAAGWL